MKVVGLVFGHAKWGFALHRRTTVGLTKNPPPITCETPAQAIACLLDHGMVWQRHLSTLGGMQKFLLPTLPKRLFSAAKAILCAAAYHNTC